MYFLIDCTPDGEIFVTQGDKDTVLGIAASLGQHGKSAVKALPDTEPIYWGDKFVIIKGEIVVPRPVEKIVEYELD